MTFAEHVEDLVQGLRAKVGLLYKIRHLISRRMLLEFYHAFIGSKTDYLSEMWGSTASTYLRSLQVLQNRAIRNIFHLPYLTPRTTIHTDFSGSILPIRGIHELNVVKYVFKALKGLQKGNLKFEFNVSMTRQSGLLVKPFARTRFGQRRISVLGPTFYNALPLETRQSVSLNQFVGRTRSCMRTTERIAELLID